VTGQPVTRKPKQIREAATLALKQGRLHPDRWAEAAELLAQHVTVEPAYPAVPGARELAHA
jgi:hypothetical protein